MTNVLRACVGFRAAVCDPVPAHIDRPRRDRPSLAKPRLKAPMHCLRLRLCNRPYLLVSELIRVDRCAGTICLPKLFLTGLFVGEFDETVAHDSSYSGVDDSRCSIAHQSCSRLGLAWRRMGLGRSGSGTCGRSVNRWRDRRVILRLRLSGLWLWLWRLWLPGLRLWLSNRLLRGLRSRLSPRCSTPYLCDRCRYPSLSSSALMRDVFAH